MGNAEVWHSGEDLAATHLERLGWTVLARNWTCPAGELDIVALEPGAAPVVVFCEVKTRRGLRYGAPLEAITAAKVAKLRELALHWMRAQPGSVPHVRFDGLGVLLPPDGVPVITHVRGISQ